MITLTLLIIFKHILGDYLLQWSELSQDKRSENLFLKLTSLAAHSSIHLFFMALLVGSIYPQFYFKIPIIDGISHFIIDFTKTKVEHRFKSSTITLIDQACHGLVYLGIICGIGIATGSW